MTAVIVGIALVSGNFTERESALPSVNRPPQALFQFTSGRTSSHHIRHVPPRGSRLSLASQFVPRPERICFLCGTVRGQSRAESVTDSAADLFTTMGKPLRRGPAVVFEECSESDQEASPTNARIAASKRERAAPKTAVAGRNVPDSSEPDDDSEQSASSFDDDDEFVDSDVEMGSDAGEDDDDEDNDDVGSWLSGSDGGSDDELVGKAREVDAERRAEADDAEAELRTNLSAGAQESYALPTSDDLAKENLLPSPDLVVLKQRINQVPERNELVYIRQF